MSDRLNTTTKNRQSSDSTFKVNPFQSRGFVVQARAEESTSATKAQLWESYQQAKHLNQNGAKLPPIQAKLTIGQPGDKYEQEADRVADRVMAMSEPAQVQREELPEEEIQLKPLAETISPLVQREELAEEEELQMKPILGTSQLLQRDELPEEELQTKPLDVIQRETDLEQEDESELQMKSVDNSIQRDALPEDREIQTKQLPTPSLESQLSNSKGGGNPLADDVRSFMEPRFGADFSGVRVHTDSAAVQMNRAVNAQAFAHGQDIYFGAGKSPGNNDLTAHELTHTIQQTGGLQKRSLGKQPRKSNKLQTKLQSIQPTIQLKENSSPSDSSAGGNATSPATDPSFVAVTDRTKHSAKTQKEHPPAKGKAAEAQSAATPPSNEVEAKAQDRQVQEMNQQQPGQFNAAKFKAALMSKIQGTIPQNLEQADNFRSQNKLDAVKGDLSSQVKSEKQQAAGAVEEKTKEPPNTADIPAKPVTPIPPAEPGAKPPDVGAADAAPKPKTADEVSLQAGSQAFDKQMTDANVTEEQLTNANEPEFQTALSAKKTTQAHADTAPAAYRQQEGAIVTQAQATAQTTAQTQLQGMHGAKQQVLASVLGQQGQAKGQDEAKRAEVASHIQGIYSKTKLEVEKILSGLDAQVNPLFDRGAATAKSIFESYVEREMDRYKDKRYSGVDGKLLWTTDLLHITTLPPEVNAFYQAGKKRYLDSMDKTIDDVSSLVAKELNAAKAAIANGKQEIQKYVAGLDPDLKDVGKEAAQNIQGKFDELTDSINNKQEELIDTLAQKYQESLKSIDDRIEEMKQANTSLFDMAKNAIDGVITTILELKNLLMNTLAKAGSSIDLIIKDPIKFLGNLVAGVKQGFMNFAGNILTHLKAGLIGWLTGALGGAGIQLPETLDMKGIFSLVTQLLGVTYQNIRGRAAEKLGDKAVTALESGFEWFVILKEQGLAGVWEHIREKIGDLKVMVLDSIQNFVIESIVKAGVTWVIGLLNPASAFIKACKAIYDIIMFFVERGSQIMELVNAVLDSVTAIANGSIDVAAKFIEGALSKALPVVISFMASLLGLGGISEKIQSIVKTVQTPINKAIDWVIGKGAKAFKSIGNKFKGSKLGKKVHAVKDAAKEKYKAGKQWIEDKKEKAHQWVEDKKVAVANQVETKKKQFSDSKFGQKLATVDKWGQKQIEKLEHKKQSFDNKLNAAKEWPKKKFIELHSKVNNKVVDIRDKWKDKHKQDKENQIPAKITTIQGQEKDTQTRHELAEGLKAIDLEENNYKKDNKITKLDAQKIASSVKKKHPIFESITIIDGGKTWDYGYISRAEIKKGEEQADKNVSAKDILIEEPKILDGYAEFSFYVNLDNIKIVVGKGLINIKDEKDIHVFTDDNAKAINFEKGINLVNIMTREAKEVYAKINRVSDQTITQTVERSDIFTTKPKVEEGKLEISLYVRIAKREIWWGTATVDLDKETGEMLLSTKNNVVYAQKIEKLKIKEGLGFTQLAIELMNEAYNENTKKGSLPRIDARLAEDNKRIFQESFAAIKQANPSLTDDEVARKAIHDTPLARGRKALGYSKLNVKVTFLERNGIKVPDKIDVLAEK